MQRGVSFTPPQTRAEASRLIDEFKRRPPDQVADRRREIRAVQDDMARGRGDAARYMIGAGERVVYGHRVLGVVRLVDHPAHGRGRRYVIERALTVMAELDTPTGLGGERYRAHGNGERNERGVPGPARRGPGPILRVSLSALV